MLNLTRYSIYSSILLSFVVISASLFVHESANAQVKNLSCEAIQITDGPFGSGDPYACQNGILFESRDDLLNNGHTPDQPDIFFADVTDPRNPVFYQITNSPMLGEEDFLTATISEDCTSIAIRSGQNLTGQNGGNVLQLYYGDISDPSNPILTQITNNTEEEENEGTAIISGDGSKIGFQSGLNIANMNPAMDRIFFVYDHFNNASPFKAVTPTDVGSGTNSPRLSFDGTSYVITSSANFMPPNQNPLMVDQLYLFDITYNPPAMPTINPFQITNNSTPSVVPFNFTDRGISGNGNVASLVSNIDLTTMSTGGAEQLFIAHVENPAAPTLTQVTKTSTDAADDTPILNFPGDRAAFISNAPEFKQSPGNGPTIVVADISDPNNPLFTSLLNSPLGINIDELSAPVDFSFFTYEDEFFVNEEEEIEQVYFLRNCDLPRNVPTISEWGLIAMAGILGLIGFMVIRRRALA
ncbi:MAG: IPTL-CTERM sorting domain-containing protein [Thermodesulfobacteriota bacterium]